MGLRYRKSLSFGPLKTNISKNGLGYSFGFLGIRYGVNALGRKYISFGIPGSGFYYIKYL